MGSVFEGRFVEQTQHLVRFGLSGGNVLVKFGLSGGNVLVRFGLRGGNVLVRLD